MEHATPPLLSLSLNRVTPITKGTHDTETITVDHMEEITRIHNLLERESFSLITLRNQIRIAREKQQQIVDRARTASNEIKERLISMKNHVHENLSNMKRKIELINETMRQDPIFIKLIQPATAGRILGLCSYNNYLAVTSIGGHFVVVNKTTSKVISRCIPVEKEVVYRPSFFVRGGTVGCFMISSKGKLLLAFPFDANPKQVLEEPVCSYEGIPEGHESDLVTGHNGSVKAFRLEDNQFHCCGEFKNVSGNVTHILFDPISLSVYASTDTKLIYSLSGATCMELAKGKFKDFPVQMALTREFLVVGMSLGDILFLRRKRDEMNAVMKIRIPTGWRRFTIVGRNVYVLTKDQKIERRYIYHSGVVEFVCGPDAAEYDEEAFMGLIESDQTNLYLTHNDTISVWE